MDVLSVPKSRFIRLGNLEIFPKVYQFITDENSFCIYGNQELELSDWFFFKGVRHKIIKIVRSDITPSGLHFYEIKTYVRKQMKSA